jgi:hypothetical protein
MTNEELQAINKLLSESDLAGRKMMVSPASAGVFYVHADGICIADFYDREAESAAAFFAAAPAAIAALLAEVDSYKWRIAAAELERDTARAESANARTNATLAERTTAQRVAAERDEWQARYEGMEAALRVALEVMAARQ